MKSSSLLLKKKLLKAKNERKHILKRYNSNNALKKIHALYEKERRKKRKSEIDKRLQIGNGNYLKVQRLSKRIQIMNEQLNQAVIISDESDHELSANSDVQDSIFSNQSSTNTPSGSPQSADDCVDDEDQVLQDDDHACYECANCKRRQNMLLIALYGEDSPYHLKFSLVPATAIGQRKFKHSDIDINDSDIEYPLCTECEQYLTLPEKYQTEQYCWPSFICMLLSNKECHNEYGNDVWRLIPREFRYWWMCHFKENIPSIYSEISIENPPTIFDDVTVKKKKWTNSIKDGTLTSLANVCNDLIIPTIMCPWGDSVFIHKTGSLPIDAVFQRYLQRVEIVMIDHNKLQFVQWTRDDYTRIANDEDSWLLNPEWKVRPAIAFVDGVPKVMTCEEHNGGSRNKMIHTCRWSHQLPCEQSDQIAQVVTQS